jgi:hypothetical protein
MKGWLVNQSGKLNFTYVFGAVAVVTVVVYVIFGIIL